jgi:hypothetical protein
MPFNLAPAMIFHYAPPATEHLTTAWQCSFIIFCDECYFFFAFFAAFAFFFTVFFTGLHPHVLHITAPFKTDILLKFCLYVASPKPLRQRPHSKLNPPKVNAVIKFAHFGRNSRLFCLMLPGASNLDIWYNPVKMYVVRLSLEYQIAAGQF